MIPHAARFFIVFLCVTMERVTGSYNKSPCEILNCANNGVCMEVMSGNGNDSVTSCKCNERYTGSRCQYAVILKRHSMASNSAKLEILQKQSNNSNQDFVHTMEKESKFTIIYWTNFSSSACAMASGVHLGLVTIENLEPDMGYTFCAVSGLAEFCHHYNIDDGMPINCVFITTSGPTAEYDSPVYIAPLVLSILFVIGLCILLAVIIKRRYIECLYKYNPCLNSKTKNDTTVLYMGTGSKRNSKHLMPLPERPPPDIVLHPPSSPGRPPHKLSQSTRGYTSTFSAHNESAIPLTTVIEYDPSDDTSAAIGRTYSDDNSCSAETRLIFHQIDTER